MKLVWNAIVKNEAQVIPRCVNSLLPYVDGAVVVDTGSSDDTPKLIQQMFDQAGKPVEVHHAPFRTFEQARNVALQAARESKLDWEWLLLADADMEFRVQRPDWFGAVNGGLSYDLRQVAGNLGYWNRRLVSRKATGDFVGVTHEYLNIPSDGTLEDAYFIDHADGANRPDKFARDIALLEEALKTETRSGIIERYEFYLAQSYFDSGNWAKAAEHYKKRVSLGGFEEERWNAQLHFAHCLDNMGNKPDFVWEMLQAYRMRPGRAETLYDLAKFFRERGENHTSLLYSEMGMQIPHPKNDLLFVNDWVYSDGLKEEFAICAYYDPPRRARGANVCNELALKGSKQAYSNLYWYLMPISEHVKSFKPTQIKIETPEGYEATNPSIVNFRNRPLVLVRTVNYFITPDGGYAIRGRDGSVNDHNPIHTRNYLVSLSEDLAVESSRELLLPENLPPPAYGWVRGFEDSRLFEHQDKLWTLSAVREFTPEGWCEQTLSSVTDRGYGEDWRVIKPAKRAHEKNWQPWVKDGRLGFVYRIGTMIDTTGKVIVQHGVKVDVSAISGGSQVVCVGPEAYLALVHETRIIPGATRRAYQHRFVRYRGDGSVSGLSPPFVFHDKHVEFAAGLAYFADGQKLICSYGIMDREAWLASMDVDEVLAFIEAVG